MNERIKQQRIKQLMIRAIGGVPCYDASVGLSLNQEEAEKFAELIIQECATVARKHSLQKYSGMEDYDGVVFVEEAIKKHFSAEK